MEIKSIANTSHITKYLGINVKRKLENLQNITKKYSKNFDTHKKTRKNPWNNYSNWESNVIKIKNLGQKFNGAFSG